MTLKAENFPLLMSTLLDSEGFLQSLAQIEEGVSSGAIRNAVLKEVKHTLSRAVYDAWRVLVSEPFFYSGRHESQPEGVQALNDAILIMSLHDIIAAHKKVSQVFKAHSDNAAVASMHAFCEEVLPLARAVASLKDKVVKGRAPASPNPIGPDRQMGTCPVCFRRIAVRRGTMVHHGYTRPGLGWQTASCPGIRFRPLEVSNEGVLTVSA